MQTETSPEKAHSERRARSHLHITCACGVLCTADNVKLIGMSDSFYSHHHSGVEMLNKTPPEFWLQNNT